ncbi:hypothetical protein QJS04_geneDACA013898 [Acorus gramineus]|uniref:Ribosomal RNA processing protein 1 homolog n=1 Tax=Acorus gramineus TaxID=55184 RepID=A0AAV9B0P4_ACOGR|nr:hypothetical protein QJS04_geneDACA013898 [Acorus gramineus]
MDDNGGAGAIVTATSVAKLLASCDRKTRGGAFRLLKAWLPSQPSISEDDLLKIWKGLFYCFWHCDKQTFQAELARRLSSLLQALDLPLAARYLSAFVSTIRREWAGIDHLRLDKFYLLVRCFVRQIFLLARSHGWDPEVSGRLVGVLSDRTLLAVDKFPSHGLNYHIADVFLDEVLGFLPVPIETLDVFLRPFITVLERSTDKVMLNKIKTRIFDRLLLSGRKLIDLKKTGDCEVDREVERFGTVALKLGISKKFFDSASALETLQGNRKVLFSIHESFLKLEKSFEKSGIDVSVLDVNGDPPKEMGHVATEEVPESNERPLKKRKKSKRESVALENTKESNASEEEKRKHSEESLVASENTNESVATEEDLSGVEIDGGGMINLDETMLSNLQKQFEKVAAEAGMITRGDVKPIKKRKRAKSVEKKKKKALDVESTIVENGMEKSIEKSGKKVRFSMKNNLVWKPQNPLPPQSLRLPPSATPRGSALKKGFSPGPIKEMTTTPTVKKAKRKVNSVKKVLKGSKGVTPAVKRLRKLQSQSV